MSKERPSVVHSAPSSPSFGKEGSVEEHIEVTTLPKTEYIETNKWWGYRQALREYVAEFAGVASIIIFGDGVVCQVVLSSNTGVASTPKGEYLSISFGWAIGVAVGMWISAGIFGAHLNPAVTLGITPISRVPMEESTWNKPMLPINM
ncbi:hypothetical protein MPER_10806, partial [Moniliophthora perniciosa FA553]